MAIVDGDSFAAASSELASTAATLANLRNHAAELERSITAHRQRAVDLRTATHEFLHPHEVSTRDESAARAKATDRRSRAEHHESQIPALERQLTNNRDEISATERTESTLRNHLLVP